MILNAMANAFRQAGALELVVTSAVVLVSIKLVQILFKRSKRTRLYGPTSRSFLIGRSPDVFQLSSNRGMVYEQWAKEYGPIYKIPLLLGSSAVVVCDLKALMHVLTRDTYSYIMPPFVKQIQEAAFGPSIMTSEGEIHKTLRRSLTPAFSPTAIRRVTNIVYDTAYKVKTQWDAMFESETEVIVDVQKWINKMTLDVMGIAGFGHEFKAIEGHQSPCLTVLDAYNDKKQDFLSQLSIFISALIPAIFNFPTIRRTLNTNFRVVVSEIARQIIENEQRKRKLSNTNEDMKDTSLLNYIVNEESTGATGDISHEQMIGHNFFILAGYETTASALHPLSLKHSLSTPDTQLVGLTWALIELARHPEIQWKLREELIRTSSGDPTWDQLKTELPYLDGVVHETLRLHPAAEVVLRTAVDDDTLPLSSPMKVVSGEMVDSVTIPKGTTLFLPYVYFNRSEELWGPDAKEFIPERWLKELTYPAKDIRGHRHMFTFSDGPRTCLGKDFAVAEFKSALSVLIRNFTFELPDGPNTKIDYHFGILPRPKPVGKESACMPMRVKQVTK